MKKYLLTIRGLDSSPVAVTGSFHDCLCLAYYLYRCEPGTTCKLWSV